MVISAAILQQLGRMKEQKEREREQERKEEEAIESCLTPEPLHVKYIIWMLLKRKISIHYHSISGEVNLFKAVAPDWKECADTWYWNLLPQLPLNHLAKDLGMPTNTVIRWFLYWTTDISSVIEIERSKEKMTVEHEVVQEKLIRLKEAMLSETPQLPEILSHIKKYISANEEVVVLLSEEEIRQIIDAAQFVSRQKVVESALSGKGKKKALKDVELADLM